jgi:hypothetical protein
MRVKSKGSMDLSFLLPRGLIHWLEGVRSLDYSYFPVSVSQLADRSIAG